MWKGLLVLVLVMLFGCRAGTRTVAVATYDEAWNALDATWEAQADRGQYGWIWNAPEDLNYTTTRDYEHGRISAAADWLDFRIRMEATVRPIEPRDEPIERTITVAWWELNEVSSSWFERGVTEMIERVNHDLGVAAE